MKSAAEIFVYSLIYYFQGFKRSRAELRRTSYAGEANTAEPPPGQQLMIMMMMIMMMMIMMMIMIISYPTILSIYPLRPDHDHASIEVFGKQQYAQHHLTKNIYTIKLLNFIINFFTAENIGPSSASEPKLFSHRGTLKAGVSILL